MLATPTVQTFNADNNSKQVSHTERHKMLFLRLYGLRALQLSMSSTFCAT